MLLVVDNGSAFTCKIPEVLESTGVDFELLPFSRIDPGSVDRYDSFVLSGRRNNDRRMNVTNARIIRHCIDCSKKLLGICYGAELLALTLGGTIRRAHEPQRGSQVVTATRDNPLVSGSMTAYESHGYEIGSLGSELESVASSDSCLHEVVRYRSGRIFGTQFHPEMSPDGGKLVENFLRL